MGVTELEGIIEGKRKLKDKEFWEQVIEELSEEEISALAEALYFRLVRRPRLKVWIKSRVEREPNIKFEQLREEVEKIFRLPLSYNPELRKEVWKEFRRCKVRIAVLKRRKTNEAGK